MLWLQSVGMCGCVAGVAAGAALEAVVVLLAVADAVYAVRLAGGELHALDVHLCSHKKQTKKQEDRQKSEKWNTDEAIICFHPCVPYSMNVRRD